MKKGIVSVLLAMTFAVASVTVGFAAKDKCTVDAVDGDKVTMTCKGTSLKAGDSVEVKAKKGGGAKIEGC